jgi:RNAse (barnase) inhibitor barstar
LCKKVNDAFSLRGVQGKLDAWWDLVVKTVHVPKVLCLFYLDK